MKATELQQAWIDVGGTFTDCFVTSLQADGSTRELKRGKTLSSGRVPISGTLADGIRLHSPELVGDVDEFWNAAILRLLDSNGKIVAETRVVQFTKATLTLEHRIDIDIDFANGNFRMELATGCEAPVLAVRRLLRIPLTRPLPPLEVRLGTTKGTNALLTRRGARTAFAVTAPFVDLLSIGDQTRPELFALAIEKSPTLCERTLGIVERLDAAGNVLQALDVEYARRQLTEARQAGIESLAICLMHSYINPLHELQLEQIARAVGFEQISVSSYLAPVIEWVARAQTTVVDAYLSPIVRDYLAKLVQDFGGESQVKLQVMTSAGGLVDWTNYSGKDSILSGPAGGVAALRGIAKATGNEQMIGLDMGGTSTDVCRVSSDESLQYESTKANVRILTPTLPIETVASGGGSECWFDGVSYRVGPQSAGALPGPACYGRGGPLTITDVNLFLGRIPESQFPFPIDKAAVTRRLNELLAEISQWTEATSIATSIHEVAHGFRAIANEQMADAVRTVSIAQGADPRTHTLVGFGGAAGQHICEIAESLGIDELIDVADGGLLSALGMGLAAQRLDAVVPVYKKFDDCDWPAIEAACDAKMRELQNQLAAQSPSTPLGHGLRALEMRYLGTDATLTTSWTEPQELVENFHVTHRQRYGYARTIDVEVVAIRLSCSTPDNHSLPQATSLHNQTPPVNSDSATLGYQEFLRADLCSGQVLQGPAIVLNSGSTLVIEPRWVAEVLSDGSLAVHRTQRNSSISTEHAGLASFGSLWSSFARRKDAKTLLSHNERRDLSKNVDPILRDCMGKRLSAIATQMGLMLQQTSVSVNVKQRRDFSCAVFDDNGQLLANAPHVPVHLGAMGETVRAVQREFPTICEGDCFITNDPYCGGSHLPDITVITPVFAPRKTDGSTTKPFMFVANRAHHADIGGITPGSMSVIATRLGEEGVVITPRKLTSAGVDLSRELEAFFLATPQPPRNVKENLADIAAQSAANARGIALLQEYADTLGWPTLKTYARHLLDAAELRMRQFLQQNYSGRREFTDHLDDGTAIRVAMDFTAEGTLHLDFGGSGPTSPHNFNANRSIVSAAVMYVLRCLIADDLPLNEGVMRCVELVLPEGVLNPKPNATAAFSPAVAAGNVETSQRVVDVLLGAFGVAAASQGTMNNLLFGNASFGFYETICGGSGAVAGHHGASGVHTHMTNTRLTDPEVLEARYPVQLVEFRLRTASGGAGKWSGGEGVVRTMEFLEPVQVSLLTSRRGEFAPFGLQGGRAGKTGSNTLIRKDGTRQALAACVQIELASGEQLELKTPGGGGFGEHS